jgi:carbamoyl-phosphate synthase large subunit
MGNVTFLVTGAGAPGIKGTLHSLKNNFDGRKVRIIGTDVNEEVIGKYLCDGFYRVPRAEDPSFIQAIEEICRQERVEVILPQVTAELSKLAESKSKFEEIGTSIAISSSRSIELSNNKYNLMKFAEELGLPVAKFFLVNDSSSLRDKAEELGFPEKSVVVKPPVSRGMRGLRILDDGIDLKEGFYSKKPDNVNIRLCDLEKILGQEFPPLLLTEYLPGVEYSIDLLAGGSLKEPLIIPRTRDLVRTGITFNGTVERNEEIIDQCRRLAKELKMEYAFGFQMKLDEKGHPKLLECNPRIQGTMVLATLAGANIIYGAAKLALGEDLPDFEVRWGTRLMRYWGGIGVLNGKKTDEIQ